MLHSALLPTKILLITIKSISSAPVLISVFTAVFTSILSPFTTKPCESSIHTYCIDFHYRLSPFPLGSDVCHAFLGWIALALSGVFSQFYSSLSVLPTYWPWSSIFSNGISLPFVIKLMEPSSFSTCFCFFLVDSSLSGFVLTKHICVLRAWFQDP